MAPKKLPPRVLAALGLAAAQFACACLDVDDDDDVHDCLTLADDDDDDDDVGGCLSPADDTSDCLDTGVCLEPVDDTGDTAADDTGGDDTADICLDTDQMTDGPPSHGSTAEAPAPGEGLVDRLVRDRVLASDIATRLRERMGEEG